MMKLFQKGIFDDHKNLISARRVLLWKGSNTHKIYYDDDDVAVSTRGL